MIVMTPDSAITQPSGASQTRRILRWALVNRRTGGITVVQWPNLALSIFITLSIALRFNIPKGPFETTLRVLSAIALLIWAADELVRGVNPFRRILGSVVLLSSITLLA
jgi:hypothetical protein